MSQQNSPVLKPFVAGADLSSARYLFVKQGAGTNDVVTVSSTSDKPIGVLQDFYRGTTGNPVSVAIAGTTKVKAGGAITRDAWVGSDGNGKAVAKTSNGDMVRGIALEAAGADGDIIEILLVGPFRLTVPN